MDLQPSSWRDTTMMSNMDDEPFQQLVGWFGLTDGQKLGWSNEQGGLFRPEMVCWEAILEGWTESVAPWPCPHLTAMEHLFYCFFVEGTGSTDQKIYLLSTATAWRIGMLWLVVYKDELRLHSQLYLVGEQVWSPFSKHMLPRLLHGFAILDQAKTERKSLAAGMSSSAHCPQLFGQCDRW